MTEIMRPASPILIGHNPGGHPVTPRIPLVLTGPAGPPVPQVRGTGKTASARPGWPGPGRDRSGLWLRNAAAGLGVLAAAAAAVSFTAQYRMADAARHLPAIAALEAAIPDAAALVFACLGIALALHGRRALRARALNLASVGTSVFMNAIAAAPGWRNLAIWALPPVAYALASDTLIGVVRARAIARHQSSSARRWPPTRPPRWPSSAAWSCGCCAWPSPRSPPWPGSAPGCWRSARSPPAAAPARHPPPARPPGRGGDGPAEGDQDRPVPGSGHRTARASRLHPARCRRRDQRRPRPPGRPAPRHRPHRPAQSRPRRQERRPPMIIKYAIALAIVLILAAFAAWAFLPARHLPGNRARHLRIRLHLRLHPGKGFAHVFSLHLRWGRLAALRRSGRIRPVAAAALPVPGPARALGLPRPRPLPAPAARPARGAPAGDGPAPHLQDRVPGRRHPALPRPGHRHHHQGRRLRAHRAVRAHLGPVHVFNPQHIGGVPSTFCWSPVDGCQDPATAIRRADAFAFAVSQKGVEDGTFWSAKASDYLRGYFHAAALAGYDLRAVAAWVSGADPRRPRADPGRGGRPPVGADPGRAPRSEAHKTAATVRMVMSRALAFMADPDLAACVLPAPGAGFGIPAFLRDAGTVYMIAEAVSEEAPVAPLFAAMAAEIHWIAAQTGQASPSGRLDPPLLMGLDEVTQICPVPLPSWLSDSGGKGIQVIAVVHGEAQLAGRWGDHGRQVVLDTSSVKVFLPGITDTTHAAGGRHAVRAGVVEDPRPGPRQPPRRRDPGHDPPAARRVRPGHPRRLRPGHRPAAPRLAQPRLPPRPPPRPGPGEPARPAPRAIPAACPTGHPPPRAPGTFSWN